MITVTATVVGIFKGIFVANFTNVNASSIGVMKLNITTFSILTLSINDFQRNSTILYAECRDYLNVLLIVIMLNVVMLSVVAPFNLRRAQMHIFVTIAFSEGSCDLTTKSNI